jgi:hypothetical protein
MRKSSKVLIGFILSIFSLSSCATLHSGSSDIPLSKIQNEILFQTKNQGIDRGVILTRISAFERVLKENPKVLTPAQWRLHDQLLTAYVQIKNQSLGDAKIVIPAKSKLEITLPSFCLNHSFAAPGDREKFKWLKKSPDIPYFQQIVKLISGHRIEQTDAQTLLWNLQSKVNWESYPDRLKAVLKEIDPQTPFKLPSAIKDQVTHKILDYIENQVPGINEAQNAASQIQGRFADYKDYAKSIKDIVSQYPEDNSYDDTVSSIPDTNLYSKIKPNGYSQQQIAFYNPTSEPQELNLADYYLQPTRPDVQRIAVATDYPSADGQLEARLENVLYDSMARLGIGFTPILGEAAGIYELLTGKDFISGAALNNADRLLSGIGSIAGIGAGYRYAMRAAYAPERMLPEFERGFEQVARKSLNLARDDLGEARNILDETRLTKNAIEESPTLRKEFESPEFKKTDFYVRPNGEVIPAKGYRYVSSNSQNLNEIIETGKTLPNEKGTYITFDKFTSGSEAKNNLQLSPRSDGTIRLEFDTKQIMDDIKIPNGKYGSANYLEPITKDYPELGQGGGSQAITGGGLKLDRVVDMEKGRVLFKRTM